MATRVNHVGLNLIRHRILKAIDPLAGRVSLSYLGGRTFLLTMSSRFPLHVLAEIEREFEGQLDLKPPPRNQTQEWKQGGIWKGIAWCYACFEIGAALNHLFVIETAEAPTRPGQDWVYFVSDGDAVKIGRSGCPTNRLRDLQAASPRTLALLATLPDGNQERTLHERFADLRISGEWFRFAPPLSDFIATLTAPARDSGP